MGREEWLDPSLELLNLLPNANIHQKELQFSGRKEYQEKDGDGKHPEQQNELEQETSPRLGPAWHLTQFSRQLYHPSLPCPKMR
jgi:hypothetical protein